MQQLWRVRLPLGCSQEETFMTTQLHEMGEGWLSKAAVDWGIQDTAEDGFKCDLAEGSDGFAPASLVLSGRVGFTYAKKTSTWLQLRCSK